VSDGKIPVPLNSWSTLYYKWTDDDFTRTTATSINDNWIFVIHRDDTKLDYIPDNYIKVAEIFNDSRSYLHMCGYRIHKGTLISPDTEWYYVGGNGVDFENDWENYGGDWQVARYRRHNNIVFIQGLVKNGDVDKNVFTLPSYLAP